MMMKWKRQLEACPEENPINSAQRYSGAGACKKSAELWTSLKSCSAWDISLQVRT